jgi:glycosyltransferase involved in cell wall biosynthesis
MTMQASVVVPTYKRPSLLERCLEALLAQRRAPEAHEVIVADDAASEETRRQVEGWRARFLRHSGALLRYLPVRGNHGPAAARNTGWKAAEGRVIAFTDDDCIPTATWLGEGVRALSRGASAAWGKLLMPLPTQPTDYEKNAAGLIGAEFVTANCFCRRETLEAAGGFDERFTTAWREDSDIYFTLLERGEAVVHAPEAVVIHPLRPAPWGVSLSQQSKARFEALLYKKHPALYRERILPERPLSYYAILASLLAAVGAGPARKGPAALTAAALWLGLTARFCARRLTGVSRAPRHVAEMIATSVLIPPLSVFWRLRGALKNKVLFY